MAGHRAGAGKAMTGREKIRLSLLRALAFVTFPPDLSRLEETASILLVRPDHLGDVLFATPALRFLRRALPKARLTLLVGPWSRDAVANNPNVDEVMTCEFPGFTRRPKRSPVSPYSYLRREARRLKEREYDLAINFRFDFWWGAMLTYFADIPHRIGYATPETKPFLTLALPHLGGVHEVRQNWRLAEVAARLAGADLSGLPNGVEGSSLEFHGQPVDDEFASNWLNDNLAGSSFALLHPGSGSPVKLWRADGFARVADELVERFGLRVVLSGATAEEPLVKDVSRQMRQETTELIGLTLGQLASVLGRSRLAIGVDSGVMHLASAVNTPTVRLYGPVDDATFGPWGRESRHVVVKSDMDCIPCDRLDYDPRDLGEHPCVRNIDVEQVLAAVTRILAT
ncbi:MAG: glycosyltransferase family 9 protein [Chloroflexi bacterium]|nr:glycosyltransferase family 9 protein [Chloroflexota bacterium]